MIFFLLRLILVFVLLCRSAAFESGAIVFLPLLGGSRQLNRFDAHVLARPITYGRLFFIFRLCGSL